MKRISAHFLLGLVMALGFALPQSAQGAAMIRVSNPSLCLDGMETVPVNDDLEPIPIAADGGCTVTEGPVSI
jgi:hypothetical protein